MEQKIIKSFPEYKYVEFGEDGKPHNMYRGIDLGFGGYIFSNPGIYTDVALLDVSSLHPNSIRAMNCFGDYTKNFTDILDARLYIKHGELDKARNMLNGKLASYLDDDSKAKDLAQALKIAINSVYGLTAANFDNPFRDIRNKNNIVALRGALFMKTLQDEVEKRNFKIVAIKTDSIKIANATKDIIDFCIEFAKKYGYNFEFEAFYDKICQTNDADYIAKYKENSICEKIFSFIPGDNKKHPNEWTVTGAQFAVPYVFKTLFSKEPIQFEDMCETKSVKSCLYLDRNEHLYDVSLEEKQMVKLNTEFKKGNITEEKYNELKEPLQDIIDSGHNYIFVGKVGNFCPILPGKGGGLLMREQDGKYYSVTGSKGYRWLESEIVKGHNEDYIDKSYYNKLVDEAVETISQYGDFEWFISDDKEYYGYQRVEKTIDGTEEKYPPCGDHKYKTCWDCPKFDMDECKIGYNLSKYIIHNK